MNCLDLIGQLEDGSQEMKQWEELLKSEPDLTYDMARGGKQWRELRPWEGQARGRYLATETSLSERWEMQLLEKRSKEEIKAASDAGCVRSQIELRHLERKKPALRLDVTIQGAARVGATHGIRANTSGQTSK